MTISLSSVMYLQNLILVRKSGNIWSIFHMTFLNSVHTPFFEKNCTLSYCFSFSTLYCAYFFYIYLNLEQNEVSNLHFGLLGAAQIFELSYSYLNFVKRPNLFIHISTSGYYLIPVTSGDQN